MQTIKEDLRYISGPQVYDLRGWSSVCIEMVSYRMGCRQRSGGRPTPTRMIAASVIESEDASKRSKPRNDRRKTHSERLGRFAVYRIILQPLSNLRRLDDTTSGHTFTRTSMPLGPHRAAAGIVVFRTRGRRLEVLSNVFVIFRGAQRCS